MATTQQLALLERVAQTYRRNSTQDLEMRKRFIEVAHPWLKPHGTGLEIGCSDGYMSEQIAAQIAHLDVVEATSYFLNEAAARKITNATLYQGLIENFKPLKSYDYVFCTWVLTHIPDTSALLAQIQTLLKPDGLLFVVVPNVRVLSRQLALAMDMIEDLYALTENDRNHGHCHAYDRQKLNRMLTASGFRTASQGGIMIKPLADFQMDNLIDSSFLQQRHLDGLASLGREYPDFCSAIYSICEISK